MSPVPTRVTKRIQALCSDADGMTRADLARRLGVTRQTVIAIEQGATPVGRSWRSRSRGSSACPSMRVFRYDVPHKLARGSTYPIAALEAVP